MHITRDGLSFFEHTTSIRMKKLFRKTNNGQTTFKEMKMFVFSKPTKNNGDKWFKPFKNYWLLMKFFFTEQQFFNKRFKKQNILYWTNN